MSPQSRQGQLFVQTRLIKSIGLSMDFHTSFIQQHTERSMDNRVDSRQFPGK